jgi:mannose-6-phosphate isomerase-like protein (cupin superfamily)
MLKTTIWSVIALAVAMPIARGQQKGAATKTPPGSLPGVFTSIPKPDIDKKMKEIEDGTPGDIPVRVVDAGRYNLGVYALRYEPPAKPVAPGAPVTGFYHSYIAEVYYIRSGSGVFHVGGELENVKENDPKGRAVTSIGGPGATGTLKGYTDQKLSTGDIMIMPPGVPHSPGEMTHGTSIIRVAIDPKKVLPLYPTKGLPPQQPRVLNPPPNLPGSVTIITKAEIDKMLKEIEDVPGPSTDRAVRTIDLANMNYRLGVYVLRTAQMPKATESAGAGWYHTHIAEIYYFLHGTGTFAIGGTLEKPVEDGADAWSTRMVRGPSVSGTFKGQTEVKFQPGDMIIAPTGVPHRPSQILSVPRDILRIAVDPDKVLPLK